eukprot:2615403-Pyramimonas_sp.AAC.1
MPREWISRAGNAEPKRLPEFEPAARAENETLKGMLERVLCSGERAASGHGPNARRIFRKSVNSEPKRLLRHYGRPEKRRAWLKMALKGRGIRRSSLGQRDFA